jgi:hypothetical protein
LSVVDTPSKPILEIGSTTTEDKCHPTSR